MKSFDYFKWLRSKDEIKKGRFPYDNYTTNSQNSELNDLGNLDYFNFTIITEKLRISWYNYFMVLTIYNKYIRWHGEDFIKENARRVYNKTVKSWIYYALKKYPYIVEDVNNNIEFGLQELLDRLGIDNLDIIDTFKNYMPFISEYDVYNFAYNCIDSPQYDYFYLLLIWFYENEFPIKPRLRKYQTCNNKDKCKRAIDCKIKNLNINTCLYDEVAYGKDYNFAQKFTDFQNGITDKFLLFAPQEIKYKALVKLYESFEQINNTNIFKEKLSLSLDKFLCNKDNPLTGNFYIPWNMVEFYNGFYLISHPNVPSNIKKFYRIEDSHSRMAFNDIKKIFLERLLPIHVEADNGKIVRVLNEVNLHDCISILEHKVNSTFTKKSPKNMIEAEKKELTVNETKILCKKFKSPFLDKLCIWQLENYKVICCIEYRINSSGAVHEEYSFIFTIKESKDKIFLAYENAEVSRSTYILPISSGTWKQSIEKIYNFFASNEINKRQQMAAKLVDLKLPGNYEYKRIFHKDDSSWEYKIQKLLKDV